MNEFTVVTLGKVIAFSKNFEDTLLKSKSTLEGTFLPEEIDNMIIRNNAHLSAVLSFAKVKDANMSDTIGDDFLKKLTDARNIFDADTFSDSKKIFEWLGFSSGGAIMSWYSLKGIAEALVEDEFLGVVYDAIGFHEEIVDNSSTFLISNAREAVKK